MTSRYPKPQMLIGGQWRDGGAGTCGVVTNPATGDILADVPRGIADLDEALGRCKSAFDR